MEASVLNNSSLENIYIVFKSSEDANIPESSQISISPGTIAKRTVYSATMNLFVWMDPSADPIWSGVVPTKVQKVIVVSPEKREVSYDGLVLPSGFSPITNPEILNIHQRSNIRWLWLIFLILATAIVIAYLFWRRK